MISVLILIILEVLYESKECYVALEELFVLILIILEVLYEKVSYIDGKLYHLEELFVLILIILEVLYEYRK